MDKVNVLLKGELDLAYARIAELEAQVRTLSKKLTDDIYNRASDLSTLVLQRRQIEALKDELDETNRELRSAQRWLAVYRDAPSAEEFVRLQKKQRKQEMGYNVR